MLRRYYDRKGEIPEGSNGLPFFELPVFNYHEVRAHLRDMLLCPYVLHTTMASATDNGTPLIPFANHRKSHSICSTHSKGMHVHHHALQRHVDTVECAVIA